MAFSEGIVRFLYFGLAFAGLVFYGIGLGSSGDLYNQYLDELADSLDAGSDQFTVEGFNSATHHLVVASLIASTVGIFIMLFSILHVSSWNYASATALTAGQAVSLGFSTVAFGFAAKVYQLGDDENTTEDLDNRVSALAIGAFAGGVAQFLFFVITACLSYGRKNTPQAFGNVEKQGGGLTFIGVFNLLLSVVTVALASRVIQMHVDELHLTWDTFGGNTPFINDDDMVDIGITGFILSHAGVLSGLAAAFSAVVSVYHSRRWNNSTRYAAFVSSLIALGLTCYTFGITAKSWKLGALDVTGVPGAEDASTLPLVKGLQAFAVLNLVFTFAQTLVVWFKSDNLGQISSYENASNTCETLSKVVQGLLIIIVGGLGVGQVIASASFYDQAIEAVEANGGFSAGNLYYPLHLYDAGEYYTASNGASIYLLFYSLFAGAVSAFTALFGFFYLYNWDRVFQRAFEITIFFTAFLDVLVLGYAAKQQHLDNDEINPDALRPELEFLGGVGFVALALKAGLWFFAACFDRGLYRSDNKLTVAEGANDSLELANRN